MNCKHIPNLLSPLLDGELSDNTAAQVRAHLDTCLVCAAELTAMQNAVALLQTDAAAPQLPTPDLYAAFQQRLVTQSTQTVFRSGRSRRASPAWLLPRLAVCVVGAVCVGNTLWHKFSPYNRAERYLLTAASSLSQNSAASPMHVNEIRRYRAPNGREFTRFFNTWWHNGYAYTRASEQKPPAAGGDAANPVDFALSYGYSTPGGVMLSWNAGNPANNLVRFDWVPSDPLHPINYAVQYNADRCASWFQQIVAHGKTAQAQVKVRDTSSNSGQYTLHIGDLKAGLKRSDGPEDTIDAPDALTMWFNGEGSLHHFQELRHSERGEPLREDTFVDYPAQPLPQIAAPNVPRNRPVVLAYKLPRITTPVPSEHLVKPVWLTMTAEEKKEVRHAIKIFAEIWRAHNAARLRNLVDTDRLLEITRPDKRAGLTSDNIWQRVWLDHLRQQPQWQYFAINVDFAFEAAPPLLDEVPFNVGEWNLDHTLPGLNVLAWVNAGLADGQEYKTGIRLYLVKRPTGWKVYQFGLMHTADASTP